MTIKEFFIDLWLDLRYGRWVVERHRAYFDRRWRWKYSARCKRTSDRIFCESKRIAEAACATENDLRGTCRDALQDSLEVLDTAGEYLDAIEGRLSDDLNRP